MKNRQKRLSLRTTNELDKRLTELMQKKEYKYLSKSDLINMVLEENIGKYGKGGKVRRLKTGTLDTES